MNFNRFGNLKTEYNIMVKLYSFNKYFIVCLLSIFVTCNNVVKANYSKVKVGAERTEIYLPLIKDKKIAVVANQTSLIGNTHLIDSLLSLKINIRKIFSPEHGFRGDFESGELIDNYIDTKTGLSVISLYGENKKPNPKDLKDIDIIIFDIQDVGVRFYTYISTLHYIMETCAENNIELLILDRPNPNGFYIDGPVLQMKYKSFVGMHPVPLVHGMTIAEYATMINGEGWLKNKVKCKLKYILCENYNHKTFYKLPVKPSPNLPNMTSVFLYPSLGLFEGTVVSVGRGTDFPFQVIGYPEFIDTSFSFIPKSIAGVCKNPPYESTVCFGYDLRKENAENFIIQTKQINLKWLINMYSKYPEKTKFFNGFFNKLVGNCELQKQINKGIKSEEIHKSWEKDLSQYKKIRKKYLLYEDFE